MSILTVNEIESPNGLLKIDAKSIDFSNNTAEFNIPSGTTDQRGSANIGALRYNFDYQSLEVYDGSKWKFLSENKPDDNIVTAGLTLNLDAANKNSYNGSGSNWYDTVNGRNADIVGNITYHPDRFEGAFNSTINQITDTIFLPESALQALPDGNSWSIEIAFKPTSIVADTYYLSMASAANNNEFIMQLTNNTTFPWNSTVTSGTAPSIVVNETAVFCITRNGSSWNLYKNGVFASSHSYTTSATNTAVTGWTLNQEQDSPKGGFAANQCVGADWYFVRLYDRILSADEVLQNFNSVRSRFSL